MDKPIAYTVTTGTFIRAIVIAAIALAIWKLHGLVLLVLTSIVIASAIEPGVAFLVRHRLNRVIAVLLMYVFVFGALFGIIYFVVPPLLADAQGLVSTIPQYINTLNLPMPFTAFSNLAPSAGGSSLLNTLLTFRGAIAGTSEGAFHLLTAIFGGIFSFGLVIVLSFYFAMQETGVEDFLRLIVHPTREEYIVSLWLRARVKIGLWMQGQLLSSLIGGILAYLGLLLLGVPYAFLIALMTALFMLVPVFGSLLSAIPAVSVGFAGGGVTLALLVAGLYLIINQFEANLIHPLVVNKVVGIPPLLVILALIVGGELAGFLGVVLAIPVAAALREFLTDYDKGKRAAHELV